MAQRGDGFQRHVAGALDGPFVVLFEEEGADQADDGVVVGEDADDVGAPLDLADRRSIGLVTGMRMAVPISRRGFSTVAYGATIRDRGTGSTKVWAGRC